MMAKRGMMEASYNRSEIMTKRGVMRLALGGPRSDWLRMTYNLLEVPRPPPGSPRCGEFDSAFIQSAIELARRMELIFGKEWVVASEELG